MAHAKYLRDFWRRTLWRTWLAFEPAAEHEELETNRSIYILYKYLQVSNMFCRYRSNKTHPLHAYTLLIRMSLLVQSFSHFSLSQIDASSYVTNLFAMFTTLLSLLPIFLLASTLPVGVSSHKSTWKKSSTLGYYELIDWMESRSRSSVEGQIKCLILLPVSSTALASKIRNVQSNYAKHLHTTKMRLVSRANGSQLNICYLRFITYT